MKHEPAIPGIHEVVRELTDDLGPTMVSALAGDRVRLTADDWVMEDGPEPDEDEAERLRFAYDQWQLLAAQGADRARAWFIGDNPRLGDESPVMAIHDGRFDDVRNAANAFLKEGTRSDRR
ncbi:hypothetical protein [Arthrobacter crystallopoietes]|uniref:Antitoxin Xre/MbcA/ParS-like toxin-binding domain-containing protein n=1 Tax=Crystallibacter crystallopoietes TaxID=37928 RepID=A0A1H1GT89_9MICC|nr:hypothetical protein [Arthrobacter crystallopoietes]AUI52392.1 hypothetical protein AC20117_17955 [Arthrobacter crystallopoietes]SDR16118.1 hypothetical protein SAMN04489742_4284 [Arthrobacter crystallopoietes]